MRHRVDHRKLNRTASHRRAMLRNMVTSLFERERITTTSAKAKEARRFAERLITRAKKGYEAYQQVQSLQESGQDAEARQMQSVALAHWRQAARYVQKRVVLKKLFNDLAPLYMDREGGYTRILRMGNRLGDNAETVMLELVGTAVTSQPKIKKPRKKREEAPETESAAEETAAGKKNDERQKPDTQAKAGGGEDESTDKV